MAGIAGSLLWASTASAATVDIGLSFNGGAITDTTQSSLAGYGFHTFTLDVGTSTSAAPDVLNGTSVSARGTSSTNRVTIYVTETGIDPTVITSPFSFIDGTNAVNSNPAKNYKSVVISAYVDNNNGLFSTPGAGLVASDTFLNGVTATGAGANNVSIPVGPGLFSATIVFDIIGTSNNGGDITGTLATVHAPPGVPLPAALPLFGSVLGGGLLVRKLRRRKA